MLTMPVCALEGRLWGRSNLLPQEAGFSVLLQMIRAKLHSSAQGYGDRCLPGSYEAYPKIFIKAL
jgi:hypothetical protein